MTSIRFRSITIGLLVIVASAAQAQAAAQVTQSGILINLEVRQLIARGEPADHARLRAHFTALADQYEADAKQHKTMAQVFIASPSVRVRAQSSADHCKRLENLATQSAATLRELATHHANLAAGTPSTAPKNATRFEAGEGAREAWQHEKEIHDLAANARTPADHRVIEEYFESIEKQYTKAVNEHVGMARAYRAVPNRLGGDPAAHCDRLVKLSRESAKEAGAVAAEHKHAAAAAK
ncbi:MAG TPA: hypothetical protein VI485_12610 [Vicinamibacterales bacterium]|nr:hypothetical protein [Vicinamibacterales bacterium]